MYWSIVNRNTFQLKVSILFSISILGLWRTSYAQGIGFLAGSYQAAMETAKRSNKPLFVEVYLTGCPHCAALAPVLEEKKVGDYFNTHFVSYKMEANSEESKIMQQQKGISYVEFPLFFFFDSSSGQLTHYAAPAEKPSRAEAIEEVLRHGKDATDPTKRVTSYPNRFAKGDRDLLFLVNYGKFAKMTKDNDRLWQINNELGKIFTKPVDMESPNGFYVLQRLINDIENPMAAYFFKNIGKYKAKFPAKDVQETGESILYFTLYGRRANTLNVADVVKVRQAFVQLGITQSVASTRTVLKELEAYFRAKDTKGATERLNAHKKYGTLRFADYSYLVRYFNENASDVTYVPSLITWANEGLKLVKPTERNTKEVADMYGELATAYLKVNKKEDAKKALQSAIAVAKAAKIDGKAFNEKLSKIK